MDSPGNRIEMKSKITAVKSKFLLATMLGVLYLFLYFPILFIAYLSFMKNSVWPFPPEWTMAWYARLDIMSDFHSGLWNSLLIGLGTGALSTILITPAVIGLLKFPTRWRGLFIMLFISPLFVSHLLIGISTLMFNRNVLGLPGNLGSAILANTSAAMAFSFLIVLAQLVRYDWRLEDAATVFGASPLRVFSEVTMPIIWPSVLGAFLVSFILSFNNLTISFYNLGATPTLPTSAWGMLRHGIEPELYALTSIINGIVFFILISLFFLIRSGYLRLGYRG